MGLGTKGRSATQIEMHWVQQTCKPNDGICGEGEIFKFLDAHV